MHARPIIARVLKLYKNFPDKFIRKALREAYPFHVKKYWPYKVWLDEIKIQRGLKRFKQRRVRYNDKQLKIF